MRFPLNVPVLTDGVVTLRAHTPADIEALYEMCTDPEMVRWTSIPQPYNRVNAEMFVNRLMPLGWDEKDHRGWAIDATDDDGQPRFAGNIDIRKTPIAEVGFALHPWARGRGVATSALRLAADWAFTEGGVEIIHWNAQVGNVASLRVAHSCGFTLHDVMPGFLYERGRVLDAWTASLRFGEAPLPTNTWTEPPILTSDRLRLRPLRLGDAPAIVEACNDPAARQWLAHLPRPYTVEVARTYINERIWRAACGVETIWCIADPVTDNLIGTVAVMDMAGADDTAGEIGYWLHPRARGKGIMAEAFNVVIAYAMSPSGLDRRRLTLYAAASNTASNKVAAACGMQMCGTLTQAERLGDGTFDDLITYELLR
ncbi:MAG: family N-acetyltransferase [Nocardioidaceae bacterium]|nr:family N-acetyltransferase [Nocardioidaceae bacterium]